MQFEAAVQTFLAESRELLGDMEGGLLRLETAGNEPELIHTLFRAAHTIKGSAGVFGFDPIVEFMHHVEALLEQWRAGVIQPDAAGVALLLACVDYIGALLDPVVMQQSLDASLCAAGEALLHRLSDYHPQASTAPLAESAAPRAASAPVMEAGLASRAAYWHISLRFGREVLRHGMDPLSFLRYLTTLGEIVHLRTLLDAIPAAEDMDPEACYLGFEIRLRTTADKATIEGVFEFVREDCTLRILPPESSLAEYIRLILELPEDAMRLGEILVASGAITSAELAQGLQIQMTENGRHADNLPETSPTRRLGEILVQAGAVGAPVVAAALAKQQHVADQKAQASRFVRVEAEKLDQLITLVGELVIAGASTQLLAQRAGASDVLESTLILSRMVEEVRNSAMSLRMVQIGATFQRFERVVRDVSRDLAKDVRLVISGGETELDKAVVEKLGDPLMHLVRNAIDHGIEPHDVRLACGKPPQARVMLNAYHDAGSIVIEVADDGGGLQRDKILQRGISRGLVSSEQTLSDQEIFALIFMPGFSTADTVSKISGRGVGMDVVKSNIEALRGTITLESETGQGATVRIRLPLTLAIIDGFLVRVGEARYVLPLDIVLECLELSAEHRTATAGRRFINLRGEALPYIRLHEVFGLPQAAVRRENLVVTQCGVQKAGLVVDELLGECQTVIKPLGTLFRGLKGIGGSTILGNGEVALILDVPSLLQRVTEQGSRTRSAA